MVNVFTRRTRIKPTQNIEHYANILTPDVCLNSRTSVAMTTKTTDDQCILFPFINAQL